MGQNMNINVHHLTRVEGHGNIVVNVNNGNLEKCEWQVPEAPRFFEAMVRDRHYTEVARITSRICGICAIGHTLASVKATEDALGIEVTPQTKKMRRLLKHAEVFDSNLLHVVILVAPDLLGAPSIFPLVVSHPDVVKTTLRLKRLGHEWGALLAGRSTHPTKAVPGGFSAWPTTEELATLRKRFDTELVPDLTEIIGVVASLAPNIPAFDRPTEYMAVCSDEEYGLYDGKVQTILPNGDKELFEVKDYLAHTNEYVSPLSTAKYTKNRMESYMAGALARFNNNYDQLHPEAKKIAEALGMKPIVTNPYLNTAAQAIELLHCVHESIAIMDELIRDGITDEPLVEPTKYGEGYSTVEVPRGILFHHYKYDKDFMCQGGDCVIPTNQNHGNIQLDFEKLVPELLAANKNEKEIELALEMLVRAYDPCISCSTHYLDVKFVK